MRVSVLKDDPGYNPNSIWFEVYRNGFKVNDCITADEENGTALVYERDINDNFIRIGDELKTTILRGNIFIKKLKNEKS